MDLGVFVFDSARSIDSAALARRAEELGFISYWVPEHTALPVHPSPGQGGGIRNDTIPEAYYHIADPMITLARASGATSRIKLGTAICLVAERNPLLVAKSVGTLDQLSGGRVLFGIGTGWSREEYAAMGGDFEHKHAQLREHIRALKTIWGNDEAEFHGRFYDFPPVKVFPKPVQKPHPPILIGGGMGPKAERVYQRIVNWADGWLPTVSEVAPVKQGRDALTRLAREAGRDPASIKVHVMIRGGLGRDRDSLKELEEAGADEVMYWMPLADEGDAVKDLEDIARQVM